MKNLEVDNFNQNNDYIIEGMMRHNSIYCLVAPPKVGKSLLALQIANSIVNNLPFLNKRVNHSAVLYISTELTEYQLYERARKANYSLGSNFYFLERDKEHELYINGDILYDIKELSETYKGKLVIIDMMLGIKYTEDYDINDYKDINNLIKKYREYSMKYHVTFLLVHHTNKTGRTLGSTGIDGFVDGIFHLKDIDDNEFILSSISRDYQSFEITLKRNDNLIFEIIENSSRELDPRLNEFLKYLIKRKEVSFTPAEMVAKLDLNISPTKFGMLLNNNLQLLEREGVSIEKNKTASARNYRAVFIDPINKDVDDT